MAAFLKGLSAVVLAVLRLLCIALFIVLALILLTNVFLRLMNDLSIFLDVRDFKSAAATIKSLVPLTSMHWFDEIVELCFTALVFYGAAALWGLKGHFCVGDWISARLPGDRSRALYQLLVSLVSVFFMAVFCRFSLDLTLRATELSTVFQIPKSVMYSCMPVSSLIMLCYSLVDVVLDVRRLFAGAGGGSGARDYQSM